MARMRSTPTSHHGGLSPTTTMTDQPTTTNHPNKQYQNHGGLVKVIFTFVMGIVVGVSYSRSTCSSSDNIQSSAADITTTVNKVLSELQGQGAVKLRGGSDGEQQYDEQQKRHEQLMQAIAAVATSSAAQATATTINTPQRLLAPPSLPLPGGQRDFLEIAQTKTFTDKVMGVKHMAEGKFEYDAVNPKCRTYGHFYNTIYQTHLGPYSTDTTEPFQFLEIGYANGEGFSAFVEFLPRGELHSIEIDCDAFERKRELPWYESYKQDNRFHCGDSSNYEFLHSVWTQHMKRPDAPPLKIVVEDASHFSPHMAQAVFFWFPRIAPGGLMIMEDIQPLMGSTEFKDNLLPSLLQDLHFCGEATLADRDNHACFPTLQPLLHGIHCEMHICVLERNQMPAVEYSREQSISPPHALSYSQCQELRKRPPSSTQ